MVGLVEVMDLWTGLGICSFCNNKKKYKKSALLFLRSFARRAKEQIALFTLLEKSDRANRSLLLFFKRAKE